MANEKRLIDANKLTAVMRNLADHVTETHTLIAATMLTAIDIVAEQKTVDAVEVVHGRWEERKILDWFGTKNCYRCTECKTHWDGNTNYCPNCGAKMDGDGNGTTQD